MTTFLLGWLALSIITAAIFCRLVHNAKVRDKRGPFYGVLYA
jgi:hypothetical protein